MTKSNKKYQQQKRQREMESSRRYRQMNEQVVKHHPYKIEDINRLLNMPQHELLPRSAMIASINEEALKTSKVVKIWTDGSCINAGTPSASGGWACYLASTLKDGTPYVKEYYGGELQTTNNRMELLAVYYALSKLRGHRKVVIRTDSKYLQNGLCSWIHKWTQNGWKTSTGTPVLNKDIWMKLLDELKHHTVCFVWVKGHASDKINHRVDMLAKEARQKVLLGQLEPRRCHAVL